MTFRFAYPSPISKESHRVRVRIIPGSQFQAGADALPEGVRRLEPGAFRALHELHADGLNSFAYSMLRDAAAAEDAVQQAFLELVQAAPRIRGDDRSLRAWLFRSVRFRCLDEIRRRERRREVLHAEVPETLSQTESAGYPDDLEHALSQLTEQQRSVLFLRHVIGMSGHETAGVLRLNRAAVFATAARAERRLRDLLSRSPERMSP